MIDVVVIRQEKLLESNCETRLLSHIDLISLTRAVAVQEFEAVFNFPRLLQNPTQPLYHIFHDIYMARW